MQKFFHYAIIKTDKRKGAAVGVMVKVMKREEAWAIVSEAMENGDAYDYEIIGMEFWFGCDVETYLNDEGGFNISERSALEILIELEDLREALEYPEGYVFGLDVYGHLVAKKVEDVAAEILEYVNR